MLKSANVGDLPVEQAGRGFYGDIPSTGLRPQLRLGNKSQVTQ